VPAGEFQPIGGLDGDLWRNIVREYSEELLGQPPSPSFSALMTAARESGKLRTYLLGIVFDALTLNAVIATGLSSNPTCTTTCSATWSHETQKVTPSPASGSTTPPFPA
jgi:hypothetical protein